MKKLVVLASVLALATVANAGLVLNLSGAAGSQTLSIDNVAPGAVWHNFFALVADPAKVTISDGVLGDNAGNGKTLDLAVFYGTTVGSAVEPLIAPNAGVWGIMDISSGGAADALPAGNFFKNITVSYQAGNVATPITLYGVNGDTGELTTLATATVYTVPEPMTMALLGLGGLFFARKK